ncbi:MAG: PPC domain-containing DNA-binding protein [Candidatus Thorarchaeota archaeon]|jgi:predicted DNA-binding protein with PD1-like motif
MVRSIETTLKGAIISRMEPGDDILKTIEQVALEHNVKSGQVTLIGAVSRAKLGYFDRETGGYKDFLLERDLEVVSGMGNISRLEDDSVVVHAHLVVSDEEGRCWGGHLMAGCEVSVTIELMIIETEVQLRRTRDDLTGLNLLDIG